MSISDFIYSALHEQDIHIHIGGSSGSSTQSSQDSSQETSSQDSSQETSSQSQSPAISHQNNVHHVGSMMKQLKQPHSQSQQSASQKNKFNKTTKQEMKEIYVRDHIRRIGKRPTKQDVDRKFKGL